MTTAHRVYETHSRWRCALTWISAALRQLLSPSDGFVAPFVVQLVGEYVVEIVEVVCEHLDELRAPEFSRFLRENGPFLARTRQRATSYWDCYYRHEWLRCPDYPGTRVLDAFATLAADEALRQPAR